MPAASEQPHDGKPAAEERLQASPEQLWLRCQGTQLAADSEQARARALAAAAAQQLQGAEEQQQLRQWLPEASASLLESRTQQDPQQMAMILQQVPLPTTEHALIWLSSQTMPVSTECVSCA